MGEKASRLTELSHRPDGGRVRALGHTAIQMRAGGGSLILGTRIVPGAWKREIEYDCHARRCAREWSSGTQRQKLVTGDCGSGSRDG